MTFIMWLTLGLIVGCVANRIFNKSGEGLVMDIVSGVTGAVVGGELFDKFGIGGGAGLNVWSMFASVGVAAIFVIIYRGLQGAPSRRAA